MLIKIEFRYRKKKIYKDKMNYIILFTTIFPSLLIYFKSNEIIEINDTKKVFITTILISFSILLNILIFINMKYKLSLLKTILFINIINFFVTLLYIIYKSNTNIQSMYLILIPLLNIIYIYNKKQI
jgi:hypothetical protein